MPDTGGAGPTTRAERIVRSAPHQAEEALCARVRSRLPAEAVGRLEEFAEGADDGPSLTAPESRVRDVVFPAVSGGEQTLRDVVAEFRSKVRPDVPAHREDLDARLVHQPLPQGPDAARRRVAARRSGVITHPSRLDHDTLQLVHAVALREGSAPEIADVRGCRRADHLAGSVETRAVAGVSLRPAFRRGIVERAARGCDGWPRSGVGVARRRRGRAIVCSSRRRSRP